MEHCIAPIVTSKLVMQLLLVVMKIIEVDYVKRSVLQTILSIISLLYVDYCKQLAQSGELAHTMVAVKQGTN